jgi:hypothetical protein
MEWQGEHTIGTCNIKGTRVWTRPSSLLKIISEGNPSTSQYDYIEKNFQCIEPWKAYGNDYNTIRGENISEIITILNRDPIAIDENTHHVVDDTFNDDDYLIIYKKEEIINELQIALEFGIKHNVDFHWM